MKFSYNVFKKLVPDIPPVQELAEKLTMHAFEVESVEGDVLDIKVLPNRYSDAASYWGMAREIAAICEVNFKEPKLKKPKAEVTTVAATTIKIPNLCRRIITVCVEGVTIGSSPKWLQEALAVSGIRSINNLVDITNYVTLETGQPLHAFDFDKMQGGVLIVRQANEGEMVETLDGKSFTLNPSALVLADDTYALDIAGIKGGRKAELTEKTKNILLNVGNFDGVVIYKTSRRIGLATDASVRFSHNVSPALVERGTYRALELIQELCGGKVGVVTDVYPKPVKPIAIKYDVKKFNAITGIELPEAKFAAYLKKLGFQVKGKIVTPPPERNDIERFEDVVEEVLRLYGLDHVKPVPPQVMIMAAGQQADVTFRETVRNTLVNLGLTEVYLYSFAQSGEISLENPLTSEQSFLRSSLREGILKAVHNNLRFYDEVRIFEVGKVFYKKTNHEPKEETHLAIATVGDIREIKGVVSALFEKCGIREFLFEENNSSLSVRINNEEVGTLHVDESVNIVEMNLEVLMKHASSKKDYHPIPKYPSIIRDITVELGEKLKIGKIIDELKKTVPEWCVSIDYVDQYKNNTTFRFTFRSDDRTLTDAEVNVEMEKVEQYFKEK